jgi:hypothetical protein
MSLFKNLTTEGLADNEDRAGGGNFGARETDVYGGKIKVAYAGQSTGGAHNVTLLVAMADGGEYRETVYVTNKKGENFFLSKDAKNADGSPKKVALPGFTTIDDICQVSADKVLADMDTEEKIVNIYDYDAKKELPKSVQVLTELTGKDVLLGIKKSLVNKSDKVGDEYVANAETREENHIEKVFHPTLRVTVVEAKNTNPGETPVAAFIDTWLEKQKGKTHDKRTIKDGSAGTSGRPGRAAAAGGPPQGGAATARKSLFGNQAAAA